MDAIKEIEQTYRKAALPQIQSGDTVRVHQLIREGGKKRVQIFEGQIIRTHRLGELSAVLTVRRIASGVGVEKTFLLHSPNVTKVEVVRRSKVRRNFLSYLRGRRGKSARLQEVSFDRAAANVIESAAPEVVSPADAKDQEIAQLAAAQVADDQADADVTELDAKAATDADQTLDVEPLAVVEKAEQKAVAVDDPDNDEPVLDPANVDEEHLKADEVESGVKRADDEDSRAQRPVE